MRITEDNFEYLEYDLPESLKTALDRFIEGEKKYQKGDYFQFDLDCDELNACINSAEITGEISERQAWHLREKYLDLKKDYPAF